MSAEDLTRRLSAILSADVKDYSRLMREDETATIRTLTEYREVMTTLVKQHHGRVVDTVGDNLLAEFASVVDAVQGAVAIQKEVKTRNSGVPENRRMLFRMGINLGDLVVEGDRIYGDGVNIAARLEALSNPGGICISRTAYDQIEDKLPFGYEYLGEKTAKNIAKPLRVYRVLFDPEEEIHTTGEAEEERRVEEDEKGHKEVKAGRRSKAVIRERRSQTEKMELGAKFRIGDRDFLHKYALIYAGVIGLLLVINILSWGGDLWVRWPALVCGFLFFLQWVSADKRDEAGHKIGNTPLLHKHLIVYLGVIGFLFILNVMTGLGTIWFHWPLLGWGFLLFLHWVTRAKHSARGNPRT